ncbi:hypothetical protein ACQ4LE_006391 [Meloidogyne hapla]
MTSFSRALELFNPSSGRRSLLLSKRLAVLPLFQVRNNCPWHRRSYTQAYFPFDVKHRLKMDNITRLLEKIPGGKHILMRRLMGEKYFITWNWPSKKRKNDRLAYPL